MVATASGAAVRPSWARERHLVGAACNQMVVGVALQAEGDGAGRDPVRVPAVLCLHLLPPATAEVFDCVSMTCAP